MQSGLTQEQLAARAGLSRRGIADLERGARRAPYAHTLGQLGAALSLSSADYDGLLRAARPQDAAAFEPLQTRADARVVPSRSPNNLPLPMTNLIGRESAVQEVTQRLTDARLVTLTGVGGCGKTRLALEVARSVVDMYEDGAWLVELGAVADPALVAQLVAGVLNVRETADEPLDGALKNTLRQRHLLLVLDNCEHMLDECAQLVGSLLSVCPNVHVLATSREPIGISGEVTWRVPSLEVPDAEPREPPAQLMRVAAVELFVQRAAAVQPRFELTARNLSAVVHICRRLDGIPLALELAAARVGALSLDQLALRLDQRFRLLTGGSRAALARQQTLSATLDWSYDLLATPDRLLFERLSVFSGGWTLEACEAVCADSGLDSEDVLALLTDLTRKSLVVAEEKPDGSERYWMLETVRDYSRHKLAARLGSELQTLRRRHAEYFVSWVEHLLPDVAEPPPAQREIDTYTRVDLEYDNLRAVLAWVLESDDVAAGVRLTARLYLYWRQRGLDGEGLRWVRELLQMADRTTRASAGRRRRAVMSTGDAQILEQRGKLVYCLACLALQQGDYAQALASTQESVSIWRSLSSDFPLGLSLTLLGMLDWILGDPALAVEHLEESLRALERCKDMPGAIAFTTSPLRDLGIVARSQGDFVRAEEYFRKSLIPVHVDVSTGGYFEARGLCHLGRTLFLEGDSTSAKQIFSQALGVMQTEQLGGNALADCLDWIACVADADGLPGQAALLFGAADAQWKSSGTVRYGPDRAIYATDLARVQAKLSATEFESAWTEGQAMTSEAAVACALECVENKAALLAPLAHGKL
ncbi:MAG: tetratricopeptide repeat protein [Chloroflexi bacterium]|nr:tetratricopeptide repeat protein [Chloroflexota bacterium]